MFSCTPAHHALKAPLSPCNRWQRPCGRPHALETQQDFAPSQKAGLQRQYITRRCASAASMMYDAWKHTISNKMPKYGPSETFYTDIFHRWDQVGYTALHNAAGKGHAECVKLLLERGADTRAKASVRARSLRARANLERAICRATCWGGFCRLTGFRLTATSSGRVHRPS